MNNDYNLIELGRNILFEVELKQKEINSFSESIREALYSFERKQSIENSIRLQSLIYYFDNNLTTSSLSSSENEKIYIDNPDILTLYVDKKWRAFEFDRVFKSADFLYKLFFVGKKLRQGDIRLNREMTRDYVYEEARLYFYLASYEELQIKSMKFASPGFINFSGIAETVKEVKGLIKEVLAFEYFKKIVDFFDYYKYKRPIQKQEDKSVLQQAIKKAEIELINKAKEKNKANAEIKLEKLKAQKQELELRNDIENKRIKLHKLKIDLEREEELKRLEYEDKKIEIVQKSINRLKEISELITELDKKNIVKGEILENQVIQTISSIHSLGFAGEKLSLIPIGKTEDSKNNKK